MSEGRPYLGMDEAARQLAVSRRTLTELIKRHPHYSWGGRKKAFYPKHIAALKIAVERETPRSVPFEPQPEPKETRQRRTGLFRKGHAAHYDWHIKRARAAGPVIYFVIVGDKVKIGFACDLARRLPELQAGCPDHYQIAGVMAGTQEREFDLHNRFMKYHYRGEWFIFTKEINDFIRENCIP